MNLEIGIYLSRDGWQWLPSYDDCSRVYRVGWLCFGATWWLD